MLRCNDRDQIIQILNKLPYGRQIQKCSHLILANYFTHSTVHYKTHRTFSHLLCFRGKLENSHKAVLVRQPEAGRVGGPYYVLHTYEFGSEKIQFPRHS